MNRQQEFRKQTEEAKLEAFSLMCRKVADLEAEVKEWKDKADLWCKTANLKDHNIMINKELEKENAELKDKLNKIERKCRFNFVDLLHDVENESKQEEQLTKAKEIMKHLLDWQYDEYKKSETDKELFKVIAEAEQFLKETE